MLTIFKKSCNPTECLPLVIAHQPRQDVPRLFKGMHLFSAKENPTKSLCHINSCQIQVTDVWTDVAYFKVSQRIRIE